MPRACPVEPHVRRYKQRTNHSPDATGLPRGASRLLLDSSERDPSTGQARGISSCLSAAASYNRETPRDKPVASQVA